MNIYGGIGVALGFFLGIIGHEYVTARVADRLGDRTPRMMGRLSFSLKAHADPLGTYILPAIFILSALFDTPFFPMFGWGKRHSLTPRNLRNPRRDVVIVALAGPVTTLVIAGAAAALLKSGTGRVVGAMAAGIMLVNVFLTVVELLPIPGRDGGRVLQRFVSPQAAMKIEELWQYEVVFLLVLFLFLARLLNAMAGSLCDALGGCFSF